MKYVNAENVIPETLLKQIQEYISGSLLYIPTTENEKSAWGEKSGYRNDIDKRNLDIYKLYQSGTSVSELANNYYLSVKSIYRIIHSLKR